MNKIELVIVLAITAVVVLVWVSSDIFFAPQATPPDTNVQSLLEPISTSFDQDTLNKISALATPGPTSSPSATSSAALRTPFPSPTPKISPTPSASASATRAPGF